MPRNIRLASPLLISAQGVTYSDNRAAPIISGMVTTHSMRNRRMPLTPDTRRMTSSLRWARPASARIAPISSPMGNRSYKRVGMASACM
ncbi:hypothetical protein D3C78_1308970 [compost metagenome]